MKANAKNDRIKHKYLRYLKEADGKSEASVDAVAAALSQFQESTNGKDFRKFHKEQAVAFKRSLCNQLNAKTGKPLSKSTVNSTLRIMRAFFHWLAREPGYKSAIDYSDEHYFNLSTKEIEVARATRPKRIPTLEQMHHVLTVMPADTPMERRDRALVALAMLTGARVGALRTLKLKHIDLAEGMIDQDGREVATKRSKTIRTWFFPVGGEALDIVTEWVIWLRDDELYGPDDELFPKTRLARDNEGYFRAVGLARDGWSNSQPIRKIFKSAFERAQLEPVNPHSVRDMLAQLGLRLTSTNEAYKAWSMNFGHANMLTTLTSYGEIPEHRRAEIIRGLGQPDQQPLVSHKTDLESRLARLEAIAAEKDSD